MNRLFTVLALAVFTGLLLPFIVQDGMFLDGVTYAAISRNLANGLGSFWAPHYTQTLYPQFFEHPPLSFGIQSLFFRLLGDGLATERIHTLVMAILSLVLIGSVWKLISGKGHERSTYWLPVLLWISTPVVFWSYRNNMIENTLTVMILSATWFILKSLISGRMIWLLPAGFFIIAAILTKGPVGLFPVLIPLWYRISIKSPGWIRTIIYTVVLASIPAILLLLLINIDPQAGSALKNYLHQQVGPSLMNNREITGTNHFGILITLVVQLIIPFIIVLILYFIKKNHDYQNNNNLKKQSLIFLLTGLSASLPLMLTLKQHDYYLVPSIPFFAIAMSLLIPDTESLYLRKITIKPKTLRLAGAVIFAALLIVSGARIGKPSRDRELLEDVRVISGLIHHGSRISAPESLCTDWKLTAYLARESNISLDCRNPQTFYLTPRDNPLPDSVTSRYQPVNLSLNGYILLAIHPE